MRLRTILLPTNVDLVVHWMILGLFPPVSAPATILLPTTIEGIVLHEGFHDPRLAVLTVIVK